MLKCVIFDEMRPAFVIWLLAASSLASIFVRCGLIVQSVFVVWKDIGDLETSHTPPGGYSLTRA